MVLLLQVLNHVVLHLDLLHLLVVLRVRLRGLDAVLLLILLQKRDDLGQLLRLDLVPVHLVLQFLQRVVRLVDVVFQLVLVVLHLLQILLIRLAVPVHLVLLLQRLVPPQSVVVARLLQNLDLVGQEVPFLLLKLPLGCLYKNTRHFRQLLRQNVELLRSLILLLVLLNNHLLLLVDVPLQLLEVPPQNYHVLLLVVVLLLVLVLQ